MATRFFFNSAAGQTPNVSPAYSADWEKTGDAVRRIIRTRGLCLATSPTTSFYISIPANQPTHDRLWCQFVSDPLMAQTISGTISFVAKVNENNAGANATLALIAKVVSQDGSIVRGTLYSVFGTDSEFGNGATVDTRIINAAALTPLTILTGDRLVIEVGFRMTSPVAGTLYGINLYIGGSSLLTEDFALTSGLTQSLNSWAEFSANLYDNSVKNYQYVSVGDGMWTGERIR